MSEDFERMSYLYGEMEQELEDLRKVAAQATALMSVSWGNVIDVSINGEDCALYNGSDCPELLQYLNKRDDA